MKLSDLIIMESTPVIFKDGQTLKVIAKASPTVDSKVYPNDMSDIDTIDLSNNMLTSVIGIPNIHITLDISNNALRSIDGIPSHLISCDMSYNPGLTSLNGIGHVDNVLDISGTRVSSVKILFKFPPKRLIAKDLMLTDDLKDELIELSIKGVDIVTSDRQFNSQLVID